MNNYLGMDLDYSVKGGISVILDRYVADTIEEFPYDITVLVVMPAMDHLFDVRKMATQLKETEGSTFHRDTARLLFLCKILRLDINV